VCFLSLNADFLMNPDMFTSSFPSTTKITDKYKKLSCKDCVINFFIQVFGTWLFDAQFFIYFTGSSKNK